MPTQQDMIRQETAVQAARESETPILDELKSRIGKIHQLLDAPEPGLFSWQMVLQNHMKELVDWWGST